MIENLKGDEAHVGADQPLRDLFGNVVRLTLRKRGRPPHEATAENRQKVMLWLLTERSDQEIAEALGITVRTLTKHYFHELAYRRTVRMHMEAKLLGSIIDQVEKGNAAAQSLLAKRLDKMELGRVAQARSVKPPKLGKKEQALIDARQAGLGTPLAHLIN